MLLKEEKRVGGKGHHCRYKELDGVKRRNSRDRGAENEGEGAGRKGRKGGSGQMFRESKPKDELGK